VAKASESRTFLSKNQYKNKLSKLSQYARTLTKQKVDSA
jgi:hypothetical protein